MIKVTNKGLLTTWCKLFKVKTKDGRELVGSFVPVGWSRVMSDDLSKVEREDYFVKFQALTDDLDVGANGNLCSANYFYYGHS